MTATGTWSCCSTMSTGCCAGYHQPRVVAQQQVPYESEKPQQLLQPQPQIKSGYMTKLGHIFSTWRRRFFKLDGRFLSYYEDANVRNHYNPQLNSNFLYNWLGILTVCLAFTSKGSNQFTRMCSFCNVSTTKFTNKPTTANRLVL